MSESLITKKALGESLKKLMSEQPFDKISIKDICDECGMNRNSFYYHFKDKQDLMIWIFDFEFLAKIQTREFADVFEFFETVCEYFYENKSYYIKAFEISGQNCFSDYFSEIFHEFCIEYMLKYFGETENREYYAKFASDSLRMLLQLWLTEKKLLTPHEVVSMAKDAVLDIAERCFDLYPEELEKRRNKKN
jgi:probable dihydroxyacetone kinase regulator